MAFQTLDEHLEHELRDMLGAEKLLVKTLGTLAESSEYAEISQAFESHQKETEDQVRRLEEIFEALGLEAKAVKCAGMEGIVEEAKSIKKGKKMAPALQGLAYGTAGQKAESYEISAYENLIEIASRLGHTDVAKLLRENLAEEQAALDTLKRVVASISIPLEDDAEII